MTDATPLPEPDRLLARAAFVRRLSFVLTRDEHDADDVAQEALLAALDRPPAVRESLRKVLGGVVRNVWRMRRRSEGRRSRRQRAAARPEALPSPAENAERAETLDRLARAVRDLDEPCRSVLLHRYFDRVEVRADGYAPAFLVNVPRHYRRQRLPRVVLSKVAGRLTVEVRGPDGRPVPGAPLLLDLPSRNREHGRLGVLRVCGEDGSFEAEVVGRRRGGEYLVRLAPGPEDREPGFEASLAPAAAGDDGPEITATDENGTAIADASPRPAARGSTSPG